MAALLSLRSFYLPDLGPQGGYPLQALGQVLVVAAFRIVKLLLQSLQVDQLIAPRKVVPFLDTEAQMPPNEI
jgi:hypothetical protein